MRSPPPSSIHLADRPIPGHFQSPSKSSLLLLTRAGANDDLSIGNRVLEPIEHFLTSARTRHVHSIKWAAQTSKDAVLHGLGAIEFPHPPDGGRAGYHTHLARLDAKEGG